MDNKPLFDQNRSDVTHNIWGGRFAGSPSKIMAEINASIPFDKVLWKQDIEGSKAHIAMLKAQNILNIEDYDALLHGLNQIADEYEQNGVEEDYDLEDIHMHVESRLQKIIGDPAGRLHTARSRNDQVATDFKLWVRRAMDLILRLILDVQKSLLMRARDHTKSIMPGFTHLQVAQPVVLGHHLLSYFEMLRRDYSRFSDARQRLNQCPLGAAALAGTGFPIDRHRVAQDLDFDEPTANSLDSVSDRDFALDYLMAATQCSLHLSRFAEELILWSSQPFSFIKLPDSYSTGSSIMPQKRNPDAAELIRGHSGRIAGALQSLIMTMKGLPLAYSKDMQNDKPPVFEAHQLLELSLSAMAGMVQELEFNTHNMRKLAGFGHPTATDMADWLVREAGLPFREAHHISGAAVKLAEAQQIELAELNDEQLQDLHPLLAASVRNFLTLDNSVSSRTSYGGTAPERVYEQITKAQKWLDKQENALQKDEG